MESPIILGNAEHIFHKFQTKFISWRIINTIAYVLWQGHLARVDAVTSLNPEDKDVLWRKQKSEIMYMALAVL